MTKIFDLEDRTFGFAKRCREYINNLLKTITHKEYGTQLVRSSGSVASNYIEANESISKKDFTHRLKICRKESKESRLWIRLTQPIPVKTHLEEQLNLITESTEFIKIFNAIISNSK